MNTSIILTDWQEWKFPYGRGSVHHRLDTASAWPNDLSAEWPPMTVARDAGQIFRWSVRAASGGDAGSVRIAAPFGDADAAIALERAKEEADRCARLAGLILR